MSLKDTFPEALILGSDQLVELDGERLDKPHDFARAKDQLQKMSGKEHRLITSLALVLGSDTVLYTDVTKIKMRTLSHDLIESYLKLDQPLDCAGSYKIERAGMSLIESIQSNDPSAIQGLPLLSFLRGLDSLKIKLTDYWERT